MMKKRANSWQNRHPLSLIWVFTVRMKKAWVLSYPICTQRRLWSDWADAQADLSLCWAHRSFCWFCHEVAQFSCTKLLTEKLWGNNQCSFKHSEINETRAPILETTLSVCLSVCHMADACYVCFWQFEWSSVLHRPLMLTHNCWVDLSIHINWMSPFPIWRVSGVFFILLRIDIPVSKQ